ncbi:hypothetical protein SSKA14_263 [Stenotrophomonas sp. SKA14]|nr:hypothetical protein SSKA14_263 [Stenotrophomonas sp. SKA14]
MRTLQREQRRKLRWRYAWRYRKPEVGRLAGDVVHGEPTEATKQVKGKPAS